MGELGLEGVGVLVGGEVAPFAAPAGDRPADAADHLLDGALALCRAQLSSEVLLRHDVGRVLGPALRELDVSLLEDGLGRIADHGISHIPLDLVERMDLRRGETTLYRQAVIGSADAVARLCPVTRPGLRTLHYSPRLTRFPPPLRPFHPFLGVTL